MLYCTLCYLNKLLHFFVSISVAQVIYVIGAICYCCHHFICMCEGGPHNFPVAEFYCICESFFACGFYAYGSVQEMLLNSNRPLNIMPMYLVCLFSHSLALTYPSVIVEFCYNQRVCLDGRMLKRWALHLTVKIG